jgi:hypothetical protein
MILTRQQLEGAMDDLARVVAYVVRGITSGVFFIPPDVRGCNYCDLAAACGSTAGALSEMKIGDHRVRFFTEEMSGIE